MEIKEMVKTVGKLSTVCGIIGLVGLMLGSFVCYLVGAGALVSWWFGVIAVGTIAVGLVLEAVDEWKDWFDDDVSLAFGVIGSLVSYAILGLWTGTVDNLVGSTGWGGWTMYRWCWGLNLLFFFNLLIHCFRSSCTSWKENQRRIRTHLADPGYWVTWMTVCMAVSWAMYHWVPWKPVGNVYAATGCILGIAGCWYTLADWLGGSMKPVLDKFAVCRVFCGKVLSDLWSMVPKRKAVPGGEGEQEKKPEPPKVELAHDVLAKWFDAGGMKGGILHIDSVNGPCTLSRHDVGLLSAECVKRGVILVVTQGGQALFHTDPLVFGDEKLKQMGLIRYDFSLEGKVLDKLEEVA